MSEMVERVAKAMAESNKDEVLGALVWEHMDDDDATVDYENKSYWRVLARAAIEAMREPTEEMIKAAIDDGGDEWHFGGHEARHCWAAMIAAALPKEDKP